MKCALVGSRYFGATVFEALRKEAGVEFTAVVVPAARRPARPRGAGGRRAGARAGRQEDRSGRRDSRRHRPHRRRPHARPRQQRGARTIAAGRHRLPPVAAAAPPRHRRRRVDDPRGRSRSPAARSITSPTAGTRARSRRRTGASSAAAKRRASCGNARSRRWAAPARPRRPPCARPRHAAGAHPGPALRDARADDPAPGRRRRRRRSVADHAAGRHRHRPGPARHRPPAGRPRPSPRRQLDDRPDVAPGRRIRRHGPFRGAAARTSTPSPTRCAASSPRDCTWRSPRARTARCPPACAASRSSCRATTGSASSASWPTSWPQRGASIEHIQTDLGAVDAAGARTFRVSAHLLVPNALGNDELQQSLGALAQEMLVDIAIDDRRAPPRPSP